MLLWFDAECLFRTYWSIFAKSTYDLTYIFFGKISTKFKSRYNTTWTISSFERTFFLLWNITAKYQLWTIRIGPYCPFRKIWSVFIKSRYDSTCFAFHKVFSKLISTYNTIWTVLCSEKYSIRFPKNLFSFSLQCFW